MRKRSESDIVRAVCDYLQCKGYFFWRQNNGAVFDPTKKIFRRKAVFVMNGVPDILLLHMGKLIGLECKMEKGKQSDDQKLFQERMVKAGGHYYLVRSTDDLVAIGL